MSPARPAPPAGVLIVCRDPKVLGTLAELLRQTGEQSLTAQTADDAWECLKSGAVGLVVLDLTAPQLEDFMFFRTARSCIASATIPFLFLFRKDFPPPSLPPSGGEAAMDGWLAVPCPGSQFGALAHRLLQLSRSRERGGAPAVHALAEEAPVEPAEGAPVPAPAGPAGLFAGQIGAIDVPKILSMLEPLGLTGALTLRDEKHEGQILFVNGAVRHARLSDIEGPDALFLLFHLKRGDFRFDAGPPATERTIEGNTMALLLEGLRQIDEAKGAIKEFQDKRRTGPLEQNPAGS